MPAHMCQKTKPLLLMCKRLLYLSGVSFESQTPQHIMHLEATLLACGTGMGCQSVHPQDPHNVDLAARLMHHMQQDSLLQHVHNKR
jgi:hypothetical protein